MLKKGDKVIIKFRDFHGLPYEINSGEMYELAEDEVLGDKFIRIKHPNTEEPLVIKPIMYKVFDGNNLQVALSSRNSEEMEEKLNECFKKGYKLISLVGNGSAFVAVVSRE